MLGVLNIKLRKIFAIIGLCVMISGCSVDEKEKIKNKIFNLLQSYKLEHEKATLAYFFIPLDGCGECIKKSIQFVSENTEIQHVKFILTSQVKKNYSIYFDKNMLSHENIIIDEKQYAKIYELAVSKPVIYLFKNEKIRYILELNDSNSEKILDTVFNEYLNL